MINIKPKNRVFLTLLLLLLLLGGGCQKDFDGMLKLPISYILPTHFPEPVYALESNPISQAGFALGRKLFYDPLLSRDNSISCGSCHISHQAFTHHGHDVSHGIDDKLGTRNSMPLMNLAWSSSFFWDGGVFHLDLTPIAPIENEVEMDEQFSHILHKLQSSPQYPALFEEAFGSAEITSTRVLHAFSQFMLRLVSDNSKYDLVQRGQAAYSMEERAGYLLFLQHCNSCHKEPLFTDYSFRNNGLEENPAGDLGRYAISQRPEDRLTFKVPTLRNLHYTAPYMHDGRLRTIDAVIQHYKQEIHIGPTLDPLLKKNGAIPLSQQETEALKAFLNTLNDETFIRNPLFQEQ